MSQDSQEIKTIEQWRWSEMQGLELLAPPSLEPFKDNPSSTPITTTAITATPTPTRETDLGEKEQGEPEPEAEAEAIPYQESTVERAREMENNSSSSTEPKKDGGKGDKPSDVRAVGFGELFRFADSLDYVLMGIGSLGAFVHGCSFPLFLRFFADLVNSFGSNANNMDKMMQEVLKVSHTSQSNSSYYI